MNEEKQPKAMEEAVSMLHANMGLNDEILLAGMKEEDLIDVHTALAYHIRHEFGLLTGNIALLESCRMVSGDKNLHADDASMVIINALWEKVQKSNMAADHE